LTSCNANALAGLASHARADTVNWRCGGIYAAAGVIGALPGSSAGKAFDGQRLLFRFALLLLAVAAVMFKGRRAVGVESGQCNRGNIGKVISFGFGTGLSGGGGRIRTYNSLQLCRIRPRHLAPWPSR
jgi:uncharacterized membrane protein YfcA